MFAVTGDYLTRTRGRTRLHWTDIFTYSGLGGVVRIDARSGAAAPAAPGLDPTDHWDNHLAMALV